jgi:DNA (cytosine-5)-methyltransferase 1
LQLRVKSVGNTNPSGKGMNGNVFDSDFLSPTLTTNKGEGIKILIKNATKKGYLIAKEGDGIDTAYPESKTRRGRVQKNMAHTLTTDDSKGVVVGTIYTGVSKRFQGGIYKDLSRTIKASNHDLSVVIAASRGQDPQNPSDRKAGNSNLEQRLEINKNGTSNTITSVQKDNYAVELPEYRIRKLTPKECWRLMGCSDEDFKKAEQVNSNSQLYKQAGNAIVVDVLEAIFSKLFLKQETNEDLR